MLPRALLDDAQARQHALYDNVAHEYDDVFPRHIAEHYVGKRTHLITELVPSGARVLDVGCGTGRLGVAIAASGYQVYGVDLSPAMVFKARERGLVGTYSAVTNHLPLADNTFDLALTVATLHHLETPLRVAETVQEMGRVVRHGGFVVLWDHNPANPYWPHLMKRVPQDSGDERLVPLEELLADVKGAGLKPHRVFRSGLLPEFLPLNLMSAGLALERFIEGAPVLNRFAAHNVLVARKP